MSQPAATPKALRQIELVVLQGTSFCNMNCTYCDLSVQSRRARPVMEPALLERLFTELFTSGHVAPEVTVVWHSGEPLTLPPSYYDDAIDLITGLRDRLVGNAVSLRFDFQTNGVLIDEGWCEFFLRRQPLVAVGVSCDGPPELHDVHRLAWNGSATASRTLRGMDLLQQRGVRYNVIAVVTRATLAQPDRFFEFFHGRREFLTGFHFNILANAGSDNPDLAYTPQDRAAYYSFFRRLLRLTQDAADAGTEFKIRNFSQALARLVASQDKSAPRHVEEASAPLRSVSVDAAGNVTTFYAGLSIDTLPGLYGDDKGLSLGNIRDMSFAEMIGSDKLRRIMQDFDRSTRFCEATCEYFPVCTGGFEITKRSTLGTFDAGETTECMIHVKTMVDALIDDIDEHLDRQATSG